MHTANAKCKRFSRTAARWCGSVFIGCMAGVVSEAAAASGPPCEPGMLFCDDFSDGAIDPARYTAFGGATMELDADGRLLIHMPSDESGVDIDLSEFGVEPESIIMDYELIGELPVQGVLEMSMYGENAPDEGGEFVAASASVWRPFWNRCILIIHDDNGLVGCIVIGGMTMGDADNISCSDLLGGDPDTIAQRITLELLGPADGSLRHRPEGTEQLRFTIEGEFHEDVDTKEESTCCKPHDGVGCNDPQCMELVCAIDPFCCDVMWDSICVKHASELCEVCIPTRTVFRDKRNANSPGCNAPLGGFKKGETDISKWRIEFKGQKASREEVAEDCFPADDDGGGGGGGGGAGASGTTIAISRIAVLNTFEPNVPPAAAFDFPLFNAGEAGEIQTVSLTTDELAIGPDTTLDMGADVIVHGILPTGPNTADALIEIDPRARNGGRFGRLQTGDLWHYVQFTINPVCPATLPDNEPPTVTINAPNFIEPGEAFTITTAWDDPDDLFIRSVVVVFEDSTSNELFSTDFFHLFPTHPDPVVTSVDVPGLPEGYYQVYAVADDGIEWDVQYSPLYVVPTPVCLADLTGSGTVGVPDLLVLLGSWGPCDDPADCPADLTNDGVVGVPDLLELLAAWGPCP